MEYMKVSQAAEKWGISARRVRTLCAEGKIEGVIRKGNLYLIPSNAEKPLDGRRNKNVSDINDTQLVVAETVPGDGLSKLATTLSALTVAQNAIVSPQIQQLATTVQNFGSALVSVIQSDAMQAVLNMGQHIANVLSSIDFTPMLKNFSQAMIPITYIHLLEKLNWPIFLIEDEHLRSDILEACLENEDPSVAAEIIYQYCSEDFLIAMEKDWANCSILNEARKPILSQALLMHNQGFYFASTSMLMCQLYGVAADIEKKLKENGLSLNREEKEYVAEIFNLNPEYINNEKGRLFQTLMFTESGMLLWNAMADYLRDVCLYSGKDYSTIGNQPLRNKICHGDQLDFGTKEHSLKAVLTIDMLVQLAYEINRIIKLRESDV